MLGGRVGIATGRDGLSTITTHAQASVIPLNTTSWRTSAASTGARSVGSRHARRIRFAGGRTCRRPLRGRPTQGSCAMGPTHGRRARLPPGLTQEAIYPPGRHRKKLARGTRKGAPGKRSVDTDTEGRVPGRPGLAHSGLWGSSRVMVSPDRLCEGTLRCSITYWSSWPDRVATTWQKRA